MTELLLKFSDLYDDEGWERGTVLDLRHLEGTNGYCDDVACTGILAAIRPFGPEGIHWIDSGDYHYASELFMRMVREPFALVLFDNHPDNQRTAFGDDILSCGSWVYYAQGHNPFLKPLSEGLPVYISIDLDVLSTEYAHTNWDQGDMTPDCLLENIGALARSHRIIAVDICGGITLAKGASAQDIALNLRTRQRIIDYICKNLTL